MKSTTNKHKIWALGPSINVLKKDSRYCALWLQRKAIQAPCSSLVQLHIIKEHWGSTLDAGSERPGAIPFMNPTPGGNTAGGATSLSAKLGGPTHTLLFCADPEICLEALTIRHFADASPADLELGVF